MPVVDFGPGAAGRRCRVCGGATEPAFSTIDRNRRLSSERFDYVRCRSCGTLALTNAPADVGAFYPPDYYRVPTDRAELLAIGGRAEREKLHLLAPYARSGGRLLEIGPAVGAFLAAAQEAGYCVQAVEMDADCCSFLEKELGVPTIRSDDPADALDQAGPFDVIALWQVIEHLPDPPGVLAAAARALAPGGIIALGAPNPQALQLRVFGARWTHIDAPRHLFLLPLQTVVDLASQHGLEVVLQSTSDAAARGWNLFGWRESLAGMSRGGWRARALRAAGSLITLLIAPIERRGYRGATFTVVLKRPARQTQTEPGLRP